jgi:hypothetical protein
MASSPSPTSTDTSEMDESGSDSESDGNEGVDICVIDADDLLDNPYGIIEAYCKSVGIPFSGRMLKWSEEDQRRAKEQFETWKGWHEDAIQSTELKPRKHVSYSPSIFLSLFGSIISFAVKYPSESGLSSRLLI